MFKKILIIAKKNIKYLIALICFYFIYQNFDTNSDVINSLKKFSKINIFLLFFLISLTIFFYSKLIHKTIIATTPSKIRYFNWLVIFLNSQVLNIIPFLGFGYRAVKLRKYQVSFEDYFGIYYLLTWLFFIFFFIMYGLEISIFISPFFSIKKIPIVLFAFVLSISGLIFPFIIVKYLPEKLTNVYNFINFIYLKSKNIIYKSTVILRQKNYTKNFFLLAFLVHLTEFFIIWVVINGLDLNIALKWIILFFIIGNITDLFQISPGNIGVSELTLGIAGIPLGLDFSTGVLIRVFIRVANLIVVTFAVIIINTLLYLFFPKKEI